VTGQDDQGIMVGFQAGAVDFSLLRNAQTNSGTCPSCCSVGCGGSFLSDKAART
jgi:hypothetical protein